MRARTRLGLVASVLAGLALAGPAAAQGAMRWQQREGEGKIFLAYEVPETSEQSLSFICEMRPRRFFVRYFDDRDRARDGMQATVEFASEGGRLALLMRAEKQELGDQMVLSVETPLTAELIRILSGGTLRVTFSEATERIPLAGAQAGIAALAASCGSR